MTDLFTPPAKAPKAVTSGEIRQAMLSRWASPEWAIMWEVAPATGVYGGAVRYADAVMMSLWPSRGLELHGVEIKVSRSDWRREAADPTKAERIAAYCERWWIHTGPGVIQDISELPPLWGWREFDGTKWTTRREAERRADVLPCDRKFLASLLRRADETHREWVHDRAAQMVAADKDAYEKRVAGEVERRTRANDSAFKIVEAFEAASGLKLSDSDWYGDAENARELGALVAAVRASGVVTGWQNIGQLLATIYQTAGKLEDALKATGLPYKMPDLKKPKRGRR